MAPWVRKVFIHILPRLLNIKRPYFDKDKHRCRATKSPYFSFTPEDNFYLSNSTPQFPEEISHIKRKNPQINEVFLRSCNGIQVRGKLSKSPTSARDAADRDCVSEKIIFQAPDTVPRRRRADTDHIRDLRFYDDFTTLPPPPDPEDLSPRRPKSAMDGRSKGRDNCGSFPPPPPESFSLNGSCKIHGTSAQSLNHQQSESSRYCPEILKALDGILFIAEHKKKAEKTMKILEDWKYVAMVLDRLFLWIFTVAVLVGTAGIILQAPTLYDDRDPIDMQYSKIGRDHFYSRDHMS